MSAITITLPDDRLVKLKEIADNLGVSLEESVRVSVEELLARPDQVFQQAADRVLKRTKSSTSDSHNALSDPQRC